ncbi:MAG: hypothetical protein LCH41_12770 [Armatimonadetes bacterium]|nr:hypothetical protein [Armatimonadota bacterium]
METLEGITQFRKSRALIVYGFAFILGYLVWGATEGAYAYVIGGILSAWLAGDLWESKGYNRRVGNLIGFLCSFIAPVVWGILPDRSKIPTRKGDFVPSLDSVVDRLSDDEADKFVEWLTRADTLLLRNGIPGGCRYYPVEWVWGAYVSGKSADEFADFPDGAIESVESIMVQKRLD